MPTFHSVTYVPKLIEASVGGAVRLIDGKKPVEPVKIYDLLERLGSEGYGQVGMVVAKDANGNQCIIYALQLENRKVTP